MYVIGTDTLLQILGELAVKLLVFFGVGVSFLVEVFNDSLDEHVADSLDESAVLQMLTAEVERYVFLQLLECIRLNDIRCRQHP